MRCAALGAVGLLCLAGCGSGGTKTGVQTVTTTRYSAKPTGRHVDIAGDSITCLSQPDLAATLTPMYQVNIYCHGGYRIDQIAPHLAQQVADSPPPDVVVINAGTNDVIYGSTNWRSSYDAIFHIAGRRCIVLFTLNRLIDTYVPAGRVPSAEQVNAEIAALAASHPNVVVVDWNAAVQADIRLMAAPGKYGDYVHPVAKGEQWIADHTKAAADSCLG